MLRKGFPALIGLEYRIDETERDRTPNTIMTIESTIEVEFGNDPDENCENLTETLFMATDLSMEKAEFIVSQWAEKIRGVRRNSTR